MNRAVTATFLALAVFGVVRVGVAGAALPANDAFASAREIGGEQGEAQASNAGATREVGEPFHASNPGGASIWFRWTAPRDGHFAFATGGSDFDTLLAAYTGTTVAALTQVDADDDSGPASTSEFSFRAVGGTVYHLAVDGFQGKVGRVELAWRPAPGNDDFADAQVIEGVRGTMKSPGAGATKEAGEPAHSREGEADRSVWFRWTAPVSVRVGFVVRGRLDAIAVYTGTSLDTLVPAGARRGWPVLEATAGTTYYVAVDGAGTESVLLWQSAPPNDDFADAVTIARLSGRATGSNIAATRQRGEPGHGPGSRTSVWYRWRAPRDGRIELVTTGSSYDTLLAAYRGSRLGALRRLAADDDSGPGLTSRIRFDVQRGRTYRIAVDGFGGGIGEIVLRWRPVARPQGRAQAAGA